MQPRLYSFQESVWNIIVGYGIAVLSQMMVFPMFGIYVPLGTNLRIGLWFTGISLIRSYILRRYFELRWNRRKAISK